MPTGTFPGGHTLTESVTVRGVGPASIVTGGGQRRVFDVSATATGVRFESLTVADGLAEQGGGIRNAGSLTLTGVRVASNIASSGPFPCAQAGRGGGIYSTGTLAVLASDVEENRTCSTNTGADGGGIYSAGTLTMSDSSVSRNSATTDVGGSGGGIVSSGSTTLTRVTIAGNRIRGTNSPGGGGLLIGGDSTLTDCIAVAHLVDVVAPKVASGARESAEAEALKIREQFVGPRNRSGPAPIWNACKEAAPASWPARLRTFRPVVSWTGARTEDAPGSLSRVRPGVWSTVRIGAPEVDQGFGTDRGGSASRSALNLRAHAWGADRSAA